MQQEISWKRNLFAVWCGQILSMAGTSMTLPFIPIYMRVELVITDDGTRALATSLFFSLGLLSFCVSNPIWGALGDRYGRKLMLLRAYFITGITFPAMYFMPNLFWLLVMRFVASMFSGTVAGAQALVAVTTPNKHQGFALGALSAAFWSGNMLGMVLGGLIVHYFGYFTAFMLCGSLFMTGGLVTLFLVKENFVKPIQVADNHGKKSKFALPQFGAAGWVLLGLMFAIPLARRCDEPFLTFLVELIGGHARAEINTGYVTASAALGGILSGFTFGRLSDRCKPLTLAVPALLIAAGVTLLQVFVDSLWFLMAARFMIFFAIGGLEPIMLAMLSNTIDPTMRGTAFGWSASVRVFGGMFGALAGGAVVSLMSVRSVFVFAAALLAGMILLIVPGVRFASRQRREIQKN